MIMRLDVFSGLVKSKSHPAFTASAWRKDFAGYRCDLMGVGVIVSVEFIVDHIIDTGDRYLISWLEFIYLFLHCDRLSLRTCRMPQAVCKS
jgi:hypothetical protein